MIYITGDVHFPLDKHKLERASQEGILKKGDILLVTGDFGVVWGKPDRTARAIAAISKLPYTILWVDGNHENFRLLESFPIVPKYGSMCHKLSDNCYHLCRGNIYTIEGKTFLALGGAMSLDRARRTEGIDWFPEEELTGDVRKKVIEALDKKDMKVDYIISHDCPKHICGYMLTLTPPKMYFESLTSDILSMLDYEITCTKWFFGHHHYDMSFDKGKYHCVYNTIIDLDGNIVLDDRANPRPDCTLDDY